MADNYNVQQIFADAGIITNTAAADAAEGERISALTRQGYGAVAAAGIPSAARNIGSSLGGMLGLDTRSKGEVLSEQLKGANLSTVEGINSAAGLIEETHGGTAALGWKSQMLQRLGDTGRAQQTADAQTSNAASNTANVGVNVAANARAEQTLVDNNASRPILQNSIRASQLPTAQKATLSAAVATGAYDGKGDVLAEKLNVSSVINVGNRATDRYTGLPIGTDPSALTDPQKSALITAASTKFPNNPDVVSAISENILAGTVSSVDDFSDFEPAVKRVFAPTPMSVTVEKRLGDYVDASSVSRVTNARINALTDRIYAGGHYANGAPIAGLVGNALETFKLQAGLRDDISIIRTGATREINTEIINGLPPGVASDKDIEIFSKGYPPAGSPMSEILNYLEASRSVNYGSQDTAILYDNHLQKQLRDGVQQGTSGFEAKTIAYGQLMDAVDRDLANIDPNSDSADQEGNAILNNLIEAVGFLPAKYR